jgi:hypothetical protein
MFNDIYDNSFRLDFALLKKNKYLLNKTLKNP